MYILIIFREFKVSLEQLKRIRSRSLNIIRRNQINQKIDTLYIELGFINDGTKDRLWWPRELDLNEILNAFRETICLICT